MRRFETKVPQEEEQMTNLLRICIKNIPNLS
jgi:hypothetical protein